MVLQPCVIVGLGNPGAEYATTRHNIGFRVLDALADRYKVQLTPQRRFLGEVAEVPIHGQKVRLLKPTTYMNSSGQSLHALLNFYKLPLERTLVVYDDADLPLGRLRLRLSGSTGGHNGIKSIIQHCHSQQFSRLKVGIAFGDRLQQQTGPRNAVPFVLGHFSAAELAILPAVLDLAVDAIELSIQSGVEAAMNHFNGKSIPLPQS
ncbi:aminoacyl-tRNA hydrolase [Thermosynechococcus sp. PP42]|uniref:aminoacyl-tRNA hydrolase n=1 Tax=Thermosynechococcus sp. PP42 TaxID=3074083 RepID=UPI0028640C22|nr:aminoacyl-tRNA hydrolase [Thermosynechococcus sp. PP42]MDR5638496.1 aminoacyl-tRNA hydrolase [Thermosynechococcus sp. PP42]